LPAIATRPNRKPRMAVNVRLLELSTGHGRVDAAAGIIYEAKIVGLESRNVGRTIGLDPETFNGALDKTYSYSRQALESAIPIYNGMILRTNHPKSSIDPSGVRVVRQASRGVMETIGELKNVRFKEDGLYGDMHLLKTHPDTPAILEMAERMPDKIALSHNAYGVPVLQNGRAVINRIVEVYSVDIVGDKPGTTNGLFESFEEGSVVKKTFKQIVESLANDFRGRRLLEEMVDDEEKVNGEKIEEMEIDVPAESSPEDQVSDALRVVVLAIYDDESLDTAEKLAKIKEIFKMKDKIEGTEPVEAPPVEPDFGAATEESVKRGKVNPQIKQLQETVAVLTAERDEAKAINHARELLEAMDRDVDDVRVNAVIRQPNDKARKELIETWPKREESFTVPRPKFSAPLMESETETVLTGEKFIAALKG
jgi:hypothetical protein